MWTYLFIAALQFGCVFGQEEFNFKDLDPMDYYKTNSEHVQFDYRSQAQVAYDEYLEDVDLRVALNPEDYYTVEEIRKTVEPSKSRFIPLDINKKNLTAFAAATSLGLVIFNNDQEILDWVQETKDENIQESADFINEFVENTVPAVAAGTYFLGATLENGKLKRAGLIAITGGLATGILTQAVKYTTGRKRPNEGEGPYEFGNWGELSFFSGHTSSAFSLATALVEVYGNKHKSIPFIAYGMAAFAAYARMYDNKHWGSDVFFGAIAGHLITKMAANYHNNPKYLKGLTFYPGVGEHGQFQFTAHYQKKPKPGPFKCRKIKDWKTRIDACIYEAYLRSQ